MQERHKKDGLKITDYLPRFTRDTDLVTIIMDCAMTPFVWMIAGSMYLMDILFTETNLNTQIKRPHRKHPGDRR